MIIRVAILLGILSLLLVNTQFIDKPVEPAIASIWLSPTFDPESPFPLDARAGMVLDRHSGEVFFKKNEEMILPIASLTKIMTAIIAIEENTYNTSDFNRMLVWSDNEAADRLGNVEAMNAKAEKIGLYHTHFEDASGLSPNNTSTILDLLKLIKYSLDYPHIWQSLALPEYEGIKNRNELLGKHGVIAGKTGFTDEAGECLILLTNDLITIVLNAQDRFEESEKLIELFNGISEDSYRVGF